MKLCKNCGAEFTPKHETRGHEQIYCSIKCRMENYKKRTYDKARISSGMDKVSGGTREDERQSTGMAGSINSAHTNRNNLPPDLLETLEGKFSAKLEAVELKLRLEQSEKEKQLLQNKVMQLEVELDNYADEDDDDDEGGMLGSIMGTMNKYPEAAKVLLENNWFQSIISQFIPKQQSNA